MFRPRSLKLPLVALAAALVAAVAPAGAQAITVTKIYSGPITAASSCNPEGTGATAALQAADYNDFCFALRNQKVGKDSIEEYKTYKPVEAGIDSLNKKLEDL